MANAVRWFEVAGKDHAGRPHRRAPAPPTARSSSPPGPPRDGPAPATGVYVTGSSPGGSSQHLKSAPAGDLVWED